MTQTVKDGNNGEDKEMSKIPNTTIEGQEKQGQRKMINSCQLPVRGKEILEKLGVEFGEPNDNDPLFCEAKLPAGWKKRPTNHAMWSEVIDEKGNGVALIFYKAAFYDRDAFIVP